MKPLLRRSLSMQNMPSLKSDFLPEGLHGIPFTKGDYWVLKIDPDYQTALVGEPNKEYLW